MELLLVMKETPSKDLIEEVALLMSLSSSFIEKDWYIVQILQIISDIQSDEFSLIFAGGTALSKAHKLIYRMSEDIDFKLNVSSESQSRKSLSTIKNLILSKLENNRLQISIQKIRAQNYNNYFAFEINYPSYFDHNSSLRNHILLEFSAKKIKLNSINKSVSSFINELLKSRIEVLQIACLDPIENAADKLSALTWRIPDRIRNDIHDDPSIVRHIHDLAILKDSIIANNNFRLLAVQTLEEDKNRSKNNLQFAKQNLASKYTNMLNILKHDKNYPTEYKYFVESMSYAFNNTTPSYKTAVASLEEIMQNIIKIESL